MNRGVALMIAATAMGCDTPVPPPNEPLGRDPVEVGSVRPALIEGATNFAFKAAAASDLGKDGKNDCVSPFSLDQSLVMLLNGSEGKTYETLAGSLGIGQTSLDHVNRSRMAALDRVRSLPGTAVAVANSIWMIQPYPVNHQYETDMKTLFGATVKKLGTARITALREVNDWVKAKTLGRIPGLLKSLDPNTEVMLLNTVTLDTIWSKPFPPASMMPFHAPEGKKMAPTLSAKVEAGVAETEAFRALSLDFAEGELSMLFLLPRQGDPAKLFAGLDFKVLSGLVSLSSKREELEVQFPKFKIQTRRDLRPLMKALGCGSLFEPGNDFGNISLQLRGSFLSEAFQRVFMEVDERGARSASGTALSITQSAENRFAIDRPFAFLVVERGSRSVLLAGVVYDPSQ
jgi:serpin B